MPYIWFVPYLSKVIPPAVLQQILTDQYLNVIPNISSISIFNQIFLVQCCLIIQYQMQVIQHLQNFVVFVLNYEDKLNTVPEYCTVLMFSVC